ncbi:MULTISPECIES: Hsp70 family protein [Lysobacter]|uniref:Hsp70 family protein n=1 Tax=Lysobacter TaxID=68 RepID=UPI001F3C3605|nr:MULTISPECIES: Hsp70 family protein [Lysobacter]UJB19335.1 Hsp70 family protein [Lysobacter capsici]UJQ26940.1 Hsp70 family protein [Lysobacter gummosus]
MKIGIDFGTSYSAAAAVIDGRVRTVRFGEEQQFRTTVYFPEAVPDPSQFELTDALEAQVDALVRSARAQHTRAANEAQAARREQAARLPADQREAALALIATPALRSETDLRRDAIRAVRRQWLEEQVREARASAASLQNAVYGEDAVEAYLTEGFGNLVQSPKSMLGYQLAPHVRQTIVGIAGYILEHIRLSASQQLGVNVRSAVLGRPVQFRSSMGDAGGDQALAILTEAAAGAGFDEVSFLEEPVAAALGYHAQSAQRHRTLVVDIGGGTTDITLAEVGGADAPVVLGSWGIARGGVDVDLSLSLSRFMPLFGKAVTRVPAHHFVEAATVHDVVRQRDFQRRDAYREVAEPFGPRLIALQQPGNTTRLSRAVESAKIELSTREDHRAELGYIEPGLALATSARDLGESAGPFLGFVSDLLREVGAEIDARLGEAPSAVFLTGGMSRAPYVREAVQRCFPQARLVAGDPSLGVVSGLAFAAAQAA